MFNQLTKKAGNRNAFNTPVTFLIGSALGAIGTYFFLTEKGVSSRKKIVEKTGEFSSALAERLNYLKEGMSGLGPGKNTDQVEISDYADEGSTPSVKAHNMINHLKHNNTTNTREES